MILNLLRSIILTEKSSIVKMYHNLTGQKIQPKLKNGGVILRESPFIFFISV